MMQKVGYTNLALIDYKEAWEYQEQVFEDVLLRRSQEESFSVGELLLCEHPHVYTLGKSGKDTNLLINSDVLAKIGATYYAIDRGGDITYHGPGQIVAYPILDLEKLGISLKGYISQLEEVVIRMLHDFGISGARLDGTTGVWIGTEESQHARKICAIGVKASRFVTMHGLALNVNANLNYFSYINPCGFIDKGVTSMEKEIGSKLNMEEVQRVLVEKFAEVFGVEVIQAKEEPLSLKHSMAMDGIDEKAMDL